MKKRILTDVIFFVSLIAFVVFTGGRSAAGENQLLHLGPEGKTISVVVFDSADNKSIYGETQLGFLKSTHTGINWSMIYNSLTTIHILGVVIDPVNTNSLYCGTKGDFKTMDGGRHWQGMNSCIPETGGPTMAVDRSNPDTVYGAPKE
jgi:hypothetical protein